MADIQHCFADEVTSTYSATSGFPPGYALGDERVEKSGKRYRFVKAGGTVAAYAAVRLDSSANNQVLAVGAVSHDVFGVASSAGIASGSYGWVQVLEGACLATVLVKDGTAVGDYLRASATTGALEAQNASVGHNSCVAMALAANSSGDTAAKSVVFLPAVKPAQKIERLIHCFADGSTVADGTTYKATIPIGRAIKITGISLVAATAPIGGTNTFKANKASSAGNTLLSAASYDPTGLTNGAVTAMTLTSTAADLALTAAQAIYVEWVAGTQTTDAIGAAVCIEYRVTDI